MDRSESAGIELSLPYLRSREVVSHPRYRWNCWARGKRPFVLLQWTHSGEGILECRHGRLRVPVDHAFIAIVPEQSTYYYPPEGREPWIFSWVNFYGALACDLFLKLQKEFGSVLSISPRGAAAASFRRLLAKDGKSESPNRMQISLLAYTFLLEWWREASEPTGDRESRLTRAVRFSEGHFREPLGVKQMAAEAGMSREHFSRIFAESTGETPSARLQRLRMKEATFLLQDTDLPLRDVAMRSGFYSERHLMRTFQRIHKVSPSQYRRRKKSDLSQLALEAAPAARKRKAIPR